MQYTYPELKKVYNFLRWVYENKPNENDFPRNVLYTFENYYLTLGEIVELAPSTTVDINFHDSMDLCSLIREYHTEYAFLSMDNEAIKD